MIGWLHKRNKQIFPFEDAPFCYKLIIKQGKIILQPLNEEKVISKNR